MTGPSELQRLEEAPKSRADLAAARLASLVTGLLEKVEVRSPARRKDAAEAMGVTAGRVTQLLSGDGNLRIATLARILDGFGYELSLTARPIKGGGETVTVPGEGRRPRGTPEVQVREAVVEVCRTYATALDASFIYHRVESEFVQADRVSHIFFPDVTKSPRRALGTSPWSRQ